jgi:hypothetical protein
LIAVPNRLSFDAGILQGNTANRTIEPGGIAEHLHAVVRLIGEVEAPAVRAKQVVPIGFGRHGGAAVRAIHALTSRETR